MSSPQGPGSKVALTGLGHFGDGNPLLLRHEAQDGEDHKAGHEAGGAVEEAEGDAVPVGQGGMARSQGKERKKSHQGGESQRQWSSGASGESRVGRKRGSKDAHGEVWERERGGTMEGKRGRRREKRREDRNSV